MAIFAKAALIDGDWHSGTRITLNGGRIGAVTIGGSAHPGDILVEALMPGQFNLHSHAFQRGFSGLTERRGQGEDSFWTWREMMYRLALSLTPEAMQAIAGLAYVEMLEAGYTRLGEFHYLHHGPDGQPYADPAEMSARIFAAAQATGIALTHLPVFYAHGGFGPVPAGPGQRRFLHDTDGFARLIARCDALVTRPQDRVGLAPHSLRAASGAEIGQLAAGFAGRPFHIHVAEQVLEVEECLAHTGARPVQWLLDNAPVGPDWCLIHATQMTGAETAALAVSGAVAGLCPVTEANLGDGIFPGAAFVAAGGRLGIGTDSNVQIGLAGELRLLEYSQRLSLRQRNVLAGQGGSTGAALFDLALKGGAQALGAEPGRIAAGSWADLVSLRDALDLDAGGEVLLDRWIFGSDVGVEHVWAAGEHVVQAGRHRDRDVVAAQARKVLAGLLA